LALATTIAVLAGGCGAGTATVDATQDAGPRSRDRTDGGTGADGGIGSSDWLHTSGNRIVKSDGATWHGRGANLHDTRSCNACAFNPPNVGEVFRRIDELVDVWGANFIRLDLESYASAQGRLSWEGVLDDPDYFGNVKSIVAHASSKPGVYVLLSLWVDPTFTGMGWPTAATASEWVALADAFKAEPRVLFGLVNEPQFNYDGSLDAQVWAAMNSTVAAIRDVEDASGGPRHIISVQGTGGWARFLAYYVNHPITAGGGENIAYEVHVYDPASTFDQRFTIPSQTIPVVIGEFGPSNMTLADCATLMQRAEQLEIPYLAWTFHMRCPPNLLVDNSQGGCGVGMQLQPTSWGQLLKDRLAQPW
jgi:endoglucanase